MTSRDEKKSEKQAAGSTLPPAACSALSPTQEKAMHALRVYGSLMRRKGGYWNDSTAIQRPSYEGQPKEFWQWNWFVGTTTINSLVRLGLAVLVNRGRVVLAPNNDYPTGNRDR